MTSLAIFSGASVSPQIKQSESLSTKTNLQVKLLIKCFNGTILALVLCCIIMSTLTLYVLVSIIYVTSIQKWA